jgi:hypothetical protein
MDEPFSAEQQKESINRFVLRLNEKEPIDLKELVSTEEIEDIQLKANEGLNIYDDIIGLQVNTMIKMMELELQKFKNIPTGMMLQYMYKTPEWDEMVNSVRTMNSKSKALQLAFMTYCKFDELLESD